MIGKIYIAGPMQGYEDFNFPAFHAAAGDWRDKGWFVFSPAEKDEEKYGADISFSETGCIEDATNKGFDLRDALAIDLEWICRHADAIYMLKGWENSKGAQAEWATARALSLAIFYQ